MFLRLSINKVDPAGRRVGTSALGAGPSPPPVGGVRQDHRHVLQGEGEEGRGKQEAGGGELGAQKQQEAQVRTRSSKVDRAIPAADHCAVRLQQLERSWC
jgi:hypothetical protein